MDTLPINRRHSPVHVCLFLANAVLAIWLVLIFTTAHPDHHGSYGRHLQQIKVQLYNQAD